MHASGRTKFRHAVGRSCRRHPRRKSTFMPLSAAEACHMLFPRRKKVTTSFGNLTQFHRFVSSIRISNRVNSVTKLIRAEIREKLKFVATGFVSRETEIIPLS